MIPNQRAHMHIAAISHPGMSGKNNEDHYTITAHHLSKTDLTPSVLAVIADGIGGHHAGEVAAEIATQTISRLVAESDGSKPLDILEYAIVEAGQAVAQQATANLDQQGMGSTCACAWVIGNRLYTASVGDSRIYLIRKRSIQQVTTDHTWVQEALEQGVITPEQAQDHPRAHVIRRYLGSQSQVVPDFRLRLKPGESDQEALENQGVKLLPGDRVLLCSDGLTDLVGKQELLEVLQTQPSQQAGQALVNLANNRGGHDNITIVILEMPDSSVKTITSVPRIQVGLSRRFRWFILFVIGLLIIGIVVLGILLYRSGGIIPSNTLTPISSVQYLQVVPLTPQGTEVLSLTLTPSPFPSKTAIQQTYTPWPTHTFPPEP